MNPAPPVTTIRLDMGETAFLASDQGGVVPELSTSRPLAEIAAVRHHRMYGPTTPSYPFLRRRHDWHEFGWG